ncbi:hypothetical protein [Sediminicurvatus halobius]|uniref:Uncharacterized protein n=1 Tax=Sediminicurvatus halobius TaxID=2182432 RepID=A0A2U2MXH2_9GAMM|nr:hypothetical protein [Spiribacter halobius]PWG61581.1 hypothetical protein DEM34_15880 [Spiribacter halobius]UEX77151.1 hypothetical protein LMH63_14520 [Spiribacter halobius]
MLRFLGRFLIALLLVAAVTFAGVRGWLWYEAQRGMEQLAALAEPWAALEWEGVDTSVDGRVEVSGLTVTPRGVNDGLYVEQLTLRADGVRDLHTLSRRLSTGDLPAALTLSARGASLNVGDALYRRLNARAGGRLWGTPVDGLACAGVEDIRTTVFRTLDERYLEGDVELRLRLHRPSARLAMLLDVSLPEYGASTVDAGLQLSPQPLAEGGELALGDLTPVLSGLRVRYTDLGFNEARNYTCAARRDSDVDAFLDAHVAAVAARLGLEGGEAQARYREFAHHGGDLQLDLTPQAAVPVADLPALPPPELTALFRGRASLNGRDVDLPVTAWLAPPPGDDGGATAAADGETARTPAPLRFQSVPAETLAEHVGRRARLSTYRGTRHEGVISAADDDDVTLENPLRGGVMRFTVELGEVRAAEVLRRREP